MAFFTYSNVTRQIIEISDFPLSPPDNCATSEVEGLTKSELESQYVWNSEVCSFELPIAKTITKKEFLKRLTPLEYAAIKTATTQDAIVDYYWQLFMVAEFIDLADQDTISGINALEQIGLLQQGRSSQILSY